MTKNITYLFLISFLTTNCTFFTTYGRDYKRAQNEYLIQNYDKSIEYCIKSLKRKPRFKKSIEMYEKMVPIAIEAHHNNINKYFNTPNNQDNLVKEFEILFNLITLLEEASISNSYQLYIKSNYSIEYEKALENAANFHYQKGIDLMLYKDKRKYKLAYNEFILSNQYQDNYRESEKHIEECKKKSIFNITIMDFENNSNDKYENLGSSISNKLSSELSKIESFNEFVDIVDRKKMNTIIEQLKLSNSGLIEDQKIEMGKIKDIDHIITGDINKIIINEPKHTYDRIKIQHQVQIGENIIINEDSTEIVEPEYGIYLKYIKKHQMQASVSIELFLEIIEVETSEIINSEIFNSEILYTDKWTTGLDGIYPVDYAISILKNQTSKKNNPSTEDMLQKATSEINKKMKNHLTEFYK